jgi:hypothetical protein
MRPKIVLLSLVVAGGLVALAVVLKAAFGGHPDQQVVAPAAAPEQPAGSPPPLSPNASNNAAVVEQLRAKELAKELDQVRELLAQGPSDPATPELLLNKVTSREPEVRKAAVEALVQLNATNVIPGLEQALNQTDDTREKAILLEAINYLKLPDNAPPPPGTTAAGGALAPTAADSANTPAAPRDRPAPKPNVKKRRDASGLGPVRAQPALPPPAAPATP